LADNWRGFNRVGGLVHRSLESMGIAKKIAAHSAILQWSEIVGEQIANASVPGPFRDGILFVYCKTSVWANELALHRPRILARLNKIAGKSTFVDIRFSARGYKKAAAAKAGAPDTYVYELDSVPLTDEEMKKAEHISEKCAEPELRESIRKAIMSALRMAKVKAADEAQGPPDQ
jgi:hypothetical protein